MAGVALGPLNHPKENVSDTVVLDTESARMEHSVGIAPDHVVQHGSEASITERRTLTPSIAGLDIEKGEL